MRDESGATRHVSTPVSCFVIYSAVADAISAIGSR